MWKEVATKLKSDVTTVKKKWRNLRDTFYRESKKPPSGTGNETGEEGQSSWTWFCHLQFLKDVNAPLQTYENSIIEEDGNRECTREQVTFPENTSEVEIFIQNEAESAENSTTPIQIVEVQKPVSSRTLGSTPVCTKGLKRPKQSIEDRWGAVIDKITDAASQSQVSVVAEESAASLFGRFLTKEMEKMSDDEQDEVKFAVFNALQTVKKARLNK
ncbi:unnamed protein product [Allacma fusca]|uniref:MADF domain-containing protein n=1 Tax=Allacma fusca TaxID=39272 RepID=A0A8J2P6U9_9HEXA|nr:unnamed protein product [Allacma fusca]